MSANHQYFVPFFNEPFKSLEDAKWNVMISFSRREAIKYLTHAQEHIYHYIGERMHSQTPIKVDEFGNITFGRTRKIM